MIYADDTLLFLEDNIEKANNFKWLLLCYEQMTGMRINFDKSDLLTIGVEESRINEYSKKFAVRRGISLSNTWECHSTIQI